MKKEFGGANGNIDFADLGKKRVIGFGSGSDLGRKGGSSKTKGIDTTDCGDETGYSGTVRDRGFKQVADASGWEY